ncbi:aminotransferase class I/II-fold pyridoxal phosphate-dependent enzyme [Dactylosporangium sp. NPDC000555]|uniref:pyridoxal phosphate-dependent aminotransferase n=1 Tax=Dactylosporangium sp. NPDC000555 TaxID=3154260 RepID=UPI003318AAD1
MRFTLRTEGLFTTVDRYPDLFSREAGTINLGPGDPRSPVPAHVAAATAQAATDGHTGYTPVTGIRALREAVAAQVSDQHGVDYDPDHVCVGNGSKQMIINTLLATIRDGDEVLLLAPYYPVYYQMVLLAGGQPVVVNGPDGDYRLPVAQIGAALTPQTRWIMLNSPNNPTGTVYSRAELAALDTLLADHPAVNVISDQVYEQLTFDGTTAPCLASVSPRARERTVVVSGVSKAYGMTGYRIGWALGPPEIIEHLARLQYITTSCASSISQHAATAALTGPQDSLAETAQRYRAAAELTHSTLSSGTRLRVLPAAAGMYTFADCTPYLGSRDQAGTPIETDLDLVQYLKREARVLLMPGTLFGSPGRLRITFVAEEPELGEALRRLTAALSLLREPAEAR